MAFEEIRNILGAPANVEDRRHGDELSENLYRMCIGMPLRYGYLSAKYYEEKRVIDRVIKSCTSYKAYYKCMAVAPGNVGYEWNNQDNEQGIGNFKIHRELI